VQLREDVLTFLEEPRFAVLATMNANGSPQQTVMWYEPRGDTIVMNTRRGRKKDRNLVRLRRKPILPRWLVATTTPPRRSGWRGTCSLLRSGLRSSSTSTASTSMGSMARSEP